MHITHGRNIAITHELFKRMRLSPSLYDTIRAYGYTLIMDEVVEIIEPINLSRQDTEMLFKQGLIVADDGGKVKWTDKEYRGRFEFIKRMAESKTIIWFNNQLFLWLFPFEILETFADIFVLTFLFEGSHLCNLFRLHNVDYRMYHMDDNNLVEGKANLSAHKAKIRELLDIYDGTINAIGNGESALSATWYSKPQNTR